MKEFSDGFLSPRDAEFADFPYRFANLRGQTGMPDFLQNVFEQPAGVDRQPFDQISRRHHPAIERFQHVRRDRRPSLCAFAESNPLDVRLRKLLRQVRRPSVSRPFSNSNRVLGIIEVRLAGKRPQPELQ